MMILIILVLARSRPARTKISAYSLKIIVTSSSSYIPKFIAAIYVFYEIFPNLLSLCPKYSKKNVKKFQKSQKFDPPSAIFRAKLFVFELFIFSISKPKNTIKITVSVILQVGRVPIIAI